MRHPVIIDFETQYSFREVKEPENLKISVAGMYDYATNTTRAIEEKDIRSLFPFLENASIIVGFNSNSFDLPVLAPYYPGDVRKLSSFDILEDVKRIIGRRLGLDDLAKATLEKKKSGHGLRAIELFREKKIDELKRYCIDDVTLTKELFDYGVQNGEIYYLTANGKARIPVQWKKYREGYGNQETQVSLTLPF